MFPRSKTGKIPLMKISFTHKEKKDMNCLWLKKEHAGDQKKWRGRIQVADPSPGTD